MKFVSWIILLGLLSWSWNEVNRQSPISVATHAGLQENLRQIIMEKVKQLLPTATDLKFHQIFTKPVDDNHVQATFSYSFFAGDQGKPGVKTTLSGKADLSKLENPVPETEEPNWSFDKLTIDGQEIEFEDDSVIKPGGDVSSAAGSNEEPKPVSPTEPTKTKSTHH